MKNLFIIAFTATLFMASCGKQDRTFKSFKESPIRHDLIVLAKDENGVRARGLSSSTPSGTKIFCEIGKNNKTVVSDDRGRFSIAFSDLPEDVEFAEFTFTVGEKIYQQGYKIKALSKADADLTHPAMLDKIAGPAFNTDKEVDDIAFFDGEAHILSSAGSLVRSFSVDKQWVLDENPKSATLLNKGDNVALGARMLARVGNFLLAPLFLTHEILLIDRVENRVLDRARLTNKENQLVILDVNPELTVKNPLDATETGSKSTTIKKTAARNAEVVMALDDTHFLAAFVNYYQYAIADQNQTGVVGPSVVALMHVDNNKIKTKAYLTLPFKNPVFFIKKDDMVWVSCTGTLQQDAKGNFASTDAGLVKLSFAKDFSSLSVKQQITLNNFTPREPAIVGDKIIIPNSWKNEIAVVDENATTIVDANKKKPDYHRQFAFTFATHFHDDIVLLGDAQGELVAFSVSEGFFPFPFVAPIVLDKDVAPDVMSSPIKFYARHAVENRDLATTFKKGYFAWVVTSSHKIYPLDFLQVFGP